MSSSLRKIYYALSPELRLWVRRLYYMPSDLWDSLTGSRDRYSPPRGEIYTGSGDFKKQGLRHLDLLKKYIDLQPSDDVLDIGSGIGRTAVALTTYLDEDAHYEGFDVVKKGVDWCQKNISSDFPNFHFTYVPLKNDLYNNASREAKDFRFPYGDDSFDRAFLFSVFTHMSIDDIQHYLHEIKRVLRPGGQCLATFFLYSEEAKSLLTATDYFAFTVEREGYHLMDDQVTAANIAISEPLLTSMVESADLDLKNITPGFWNRPSADRQDRDFQDIVVLEA